MTRVDIHIYVMNMPFLSSSEAKNECEATNKIYFSRFTRRNKWHIHYINLNFLFIIYNFKPGRFLYYMMSYKFAHYIILMVILHNVPCQPKLKP